MDLKMLRYFVEVAEARSVGKAAMRLHMAQPPLSVQIRNLESRLGTTLFRREPDGMHLTEAGRALFTRAKEALALAEDGFEAARAVAAGHRGRLTIGYMFALGYAVLPRLVPQLRRTLPGVELQFVEMSTRTYEALIWELKVTVGLCMPPLVREGVASESVGQQPLMLVMPTRSVLARQTVVAVEKLQGVQLIGLPVPDKSARTSTVSTLLSRHNVTVRTVHRVETVHSALALVLAGEGLAILPACASVGSPPGVVFRRLQGAEEGLEVAVCWRKDVDNPLVSRFIDAVRSALE
ncbi:DNA-binding transcriptional LysR family regulator [Hydrogenophaga palleronii]|uniref:DNA-binding transcriptional LysR family regulator n=1 Tax=Hydrogenophaga palleronii TaxID=65655 RepID=A0ABU1WNW7_9BURK|nr:LysR substrate-binding domain-containing protein [Hydrogenophaga palleronii]MDR7150968.1 DNA-binding transcriptional LysR family regulator [Hydrogenophaga palleronii]